MKAAVGVLVYWAFLGLVLVAGTAWTLAECVRRLMRL